MQTATTDSLVGRKLEGRYRIVDRIARGGMSTVYSAVDERLDRLVAVKVMSATLSADPAFTDRFAREARAAARLTHLNAVSVYDQGQDYASDGHHVFLVMELVEGRTLRDLIRERSRLTTAEAVSIMEPVLSALAAAHRAGLVHHDVKPENILLSDEGVVKVADFGLARAVETDAAATRTGLIMGTVAYCAPEQISRGRSDPRSDVYSAGVMLFELLTGKPPYEGDSAMNVAYQHVHNRVPAPSSKVRSVPSEIDEIVVEATDSDPEGRPADAGEMLAEIADARSVLALPVTPVPPRGRHRGGRDEQRRQAHRGNGPAAGPGVAGAATTALAGGNGGGRAGRARPARAEHATTETLRSGGTHDTVAVSSPEQPGGDTRDHRAGGGRDQPPPPVVITPVDARRRRRRRTIIGALLVLMVGLGAFFGARAVIQWRFAHVPDVTGAGRSVAVGHLRDAGYKVAVLPGREFSDRVPAGHVIRTKPSSGTRLATGKTVAVTLSAGSQTFTLPSVRGSSFEQARTTLTALGNLDVAATPHQKFDDTVPRGKVIGTDPKAGASVTRKDLVRIIVSKGPPIIAVPDISPGTPLADAKQTLEAKKFKTTTTEVFSDKIDKGNVVSIDPSGRARKFSTITITVSKGPQTVSVPDIPTGTSVTDAEKMLRDVGLVPVVRSIPGPDSGVFYQTPSAGSTAKVGDAVTLYVIGH